MGLLYKVLIWLITIVVIIIFVKDIIIPLLTS